MHHLAQGLCCWSVYHITGLWGPVLLVKFTLALQWHIPVFKIWVCLLSYRSLLNKGECAVQRMSWGEPISHGGSRAVTVSCLNHNKFSGWNQSHRGYIWYNHTYNYKTRKQSVDVEIIFHHVNEGSLYQQHVRILMQMEKLQIQM